MVDTGQQHLMAGRPDQILGVKQAIMSAARSDAAQALMLRIQQRRRFARPGCDRDSPGVLGDEIEVGQPISYHPASELCARRLRAKRTDSYVRNALLEPIGARRPLPMFGIDYPLQDCTPGPGSLAQHDGMSSFAQHRGIAKQCEYVEAAFTVAQEEQAPIRVNTLPEIVLEQRGVRFNRARGMTPGDDAVNTEALQQLQGSREMPRNPPAEQATNQNSRDSRSLRTQPGQRTITPKPLPPGRDKLLRKVACPAGQAG